MAMPPEPYYTVNEAAAELEVTPRWIYEILLNGRLAGYQPNGRHWRIRPAALQKYRKRRDNLATRTTAGDRVLAAIAVIATAGGKVTSRAIAQELGTTPAAMSSALQLLKASGRVIMLGGRFDAHWLLAPDETGGEAMQTEHSQHDRKQHDHQHGALSRARMAATPARA